MKFDGIEIVGLPAGYAPKTIVITDDKNMNPEFGFNAVVFIEKYQPRRVQDMADSK